MTEARKPKISSVADRIRGSIAIFLMIASWSLANTTESSQLQVSCVLAGILYMCTSLAYVFKDVDSFEN
jgi:hypothetical protein